MRLRDVGISLFGSGVVYVAMAACSSGGGSSGGLTTKAYGTGGGGGRGATTASTSSSLGGGGGSSSGPSASGGPSGSGGASGASGTSASSGGTGPRDSGIFDALTDPVSTAFADPTNGSRLKATFVTGSDGSKAYVTTVWYDSQRSENCSFTVAGDGQTRCLPDGAAGGLFADSACTQPVLSMPTGCSAPTYALTQTAASCSTTVGGTHVYSVGAATSPAGIYVQSGTSCFSAGTGASGFVYYSVGSEVPASSFVAATTGHD